MKQIILLCLILISCSTKKQDNYAKINQEVENFIITKMDELKIPGLAIAVIKDGEIIKKSVYGYGNLEWENKVTEHSNFQIASSTKLLTSTLLLKTIYNRKIDLENSISTYIDSLPEEWQKIKVKHLISHSSGIPEMDQVESESTLTAEDVINLLIAKPLEYKPGTKFVYGQVEYFVLAYILEKIYNKPFTQLIKDEVTIPMNMNDGAYDMEKKVGSPLGGGTYTQSEFVKKKVSTYYNDNGTMVKYKFY